MIFVRFYLYLDFFTLSILGEIDSVEKTEWSLLHEKIQQFQSEDRLNLLDILKSYHQVLNDRSTLLGSNLKMKMLNDELRMLLRRATAQSYMFCSSKGFYTFNIILKNYSMISILSALLYIFVCCIRQKMQIPFRWDIALLNFPIHNEVPNTASIK